MSANFVSMSDFQELLELSDEDMIVHKLKYGDYMTKDEFTKEINARVRDEFLGSLGT